MAEARKRIDITTEFSAIKEEYNKRQLQQLICALVLGKTGSGKTQLVETCRRPIHIDSFDPKGTSTIGKGIREGWIIADTRYEIEDPTDPSAFELWDAEFERRVDGGYFDQIGTYVLDGITMWSDAIMNIVLKGLVRKADRAKTQTKAGGEKVTVIDTDLLMIPQQNDYPLQMVIIKNALKTIINLPCDVIVIGHIGDKKDKAGNIVGQGLIVTGILAEQIPRIFEEIYIMKREVKASGSEHFLHTQRAEGVDARTRIGRGIFPSKMEPDIMKLLELAGKKPIHKPMPWLDK